MNERALRDFSTYYLALGIALLLAARRPARCFLILALATLEYSLHAVDIDHANPAWVGPADLAASQPRPFSSHISPGGPRRDR